MTHIHSAVKTLPPAFYIADRKRGQNNIAIAKRLAPGTGIILRDYTAPDRADLARALSDIAQKRGLVLLVAGDAKLAEAVNAHGLHLPQWQLESPPPIKTGWIVTAAVHDRQALRTAYRLGADAALVSPVFPTPSHPDATPLGVHGLKRLIARARLPVYALGGITARTLHRLPTGISGIAALSAFSDGRFRRALLSYQKLKRVPR